MMKKTSLLNENIKKCDDTLFVCINSSAEVVTANHAFSAAFPHIAASFIDSVAENEKEIAETAVNECFLHPTITYDVLLEHTNEMCVEWKMTALALDGKKLLHATGKIKKQGSDNAEEQCLPTHILQNVFNYSLDIICVINKEGNFVAVSSVCIAILGYQPKELEGKSFLELVYTDDRKKTVAVTNEVMKGKRLTDFENRYVRKDGSTVPLFWTARWIETEQLIYCVARDATKTKQYENALQASEEKYKILFNQNPIPMWIYENDNYRFLEVNEAAIRHYGYSREEFGGMSIKDIRPKEELKRLMQNGVDKRFLSSYKTIWKHRKKNGEIIDVEITAHPIKFDGKQGKLVLINDITEHLVAEKQLLLSNERYTYASMASFDAIWDWDLKTNDLYWSERYEDLFGYKPANNRERFSTWLKKVHPEDKGRVSKKFRAMLNTSETIWQDEYRFKKADGSYAYITNRGIIIRNENGKPYRMIGVVHDYTNKYNNEQALKELNASLEKRASELASSNQELERFAYVASHDLQEPLRMVSSFLQLLQKRYKNQLDEKANEYIDFAVDGAERMKVLILDLLKYSRVNTLKETFELVNLNEVGKNILFTYSQRIDEMKAVIELEELPNVWAVKTQMMQLFQNLIGNALKYKSDRPLHIKIGAEEFGDHWQLYVQDNGIGIQQRFFDKIFVIFQRLHHKNEYSGTGIGLAICKKIVERHGGKIWVESTPDVGSQFYFTLKKMK